MDQVVARVNGGSQRAYIPPKAGIQRGVLVDVIDLGLKSNPFKPGTVQPKVKEVFELDQQKPDSEFQFKISKTYTNSLHEKASLRQDLTTWGVPIPPDGELDLTSLIGRPALLFIVHEQARDGSGKVFAKIKSIMPDDSGNPYKPSGTYTRYTPEEDRVPF